MPRFYTVMLTAIILVTACTVVAQPKDGWNDPYKSALERISTDPDDVIKEVTAHNHSQQLPPFLIAQHHYVLSNANYALTLPEAALNSARQAIELTDSDIHPWYYHRYRLAESLALDINGRSSEALVGTNAALVWGELQQDTGLIIYALYARGIIHNSLTDYRAALRDLQRAYDLAANDSPRRSKGDIAGLIALVYEYRRENQLAIPFFEEAVDFHRNRQHWLELSIALYGLGRANNKIGNTNEGIEQLRESARIARQVNDTQGIAYAIKELGSIEIDRDNLNLAEALFTEALSIFEQSNNPHMQLDAALSLATIALKQKHTAAAEQFLLHAEEILDPDSMPLRKISVQEKKAELLALKQEYKGAFDLLLDTIPHKQRLFSQRSTQQLISLRSQYELNAKARENEILEQKNVSQRVDLKESQTKYWQLMLLFVASLVISSLLVVLVYRTKQNRARLEKLANIDGLTGLNNRRHTLELLETQVDLASRHELTLSVVIADLDHFKQINDTFGHAAGDRVLKAFGRLCRDTFRHTDIVGRIGGEEFIIAMPMTNKDDAIKTMKSLSIKVCEMGNNLDIDGLQLSVSCGVASHKGALNVAELMLQADKALYQAKENGRNRVEAYSAD